MASSSALPLRFEDSHKHRDRDCFSLSADISVYSGPQFVPRGKRQKMDFANLHSWVEIKPRQEYDAFDDGPATEEEGLHKPPPAPNVVSDEEGDVQLIEEGEDDREPSLDIAADSEDPRFSREFEDDTPEEPVTTLKGLPSFPFENGSARGCDTRAQLASYAGAVLATQYRNHLFTLLIVGKRARFIRWERASAIVTRSFDFTEEPLLIFEFFKRFRQLTLTQRGSNPHIKPATKEEAKLARTLLKDKAPELWLGLAGWVYLRDNAIDINTQSFLKFEFDGQPIVIPAPHCGERGLSPFGTASRGVVAIALDKEEQRRGTVCFVKDGWRDLRRLSEHEIYNKLHAAGVRNIADILCGGDWNVLQLDDEGDEIPNGRDLSATIGHIYASKPWVRRAEEKKVKLRRLQKNVIVLKVIGLPLSAFRKAYELVGGLADAMEGACHATLASLYVRILTFDLSSIRGCIAESEDYASRYQRSQHPPSPHGVWRSEGYSHRLGS